MIVVNYNNYQKVSYLNSANSITSSVYSAFDSAKNYFKLARINNHLAEENAMLRSALRAQAGFTIHPDSILKTIDSTWADYQFVAARVINNSTSKPNNYITLNRGAKHGVKPDQGIVSASGVVGVIAHVSDSYSLGISLLNSRWGVSAKLKKSGFFAPVSWDGNDYRIASLNDIPFHVEIEQGDTVITSGYSSIFPEGVMIGTIQSYMRPEGENYYKINVRLSTNFKQLTFVSVVNNLKRDDILELENQIQDGTDSN